MIRRSYFFIVSRQTGLGTEESSGVTTRKSLFPEHEEAFGILKEFLDKEHPDTKGYNLIKEFRRL